MKKIIISALALVALAVPVAASASVTVNPDGTGFVGKGNVQTAFGWNNQKLQDNAKSVTFSGSQSVTQSLSQDISQVLTQTGTQNGIQSGVQSATQVGTQDVTETIRCSKNGADIQNVRHGIRDASREGSREATRQASREASRVGSREGDRVGTRSGTRSGNIASVLDGDPRQVKGQQQFTGFILKGYTPGSVVTTPGADNMDASTDSWSGDRFLTGFSGYGNWSDNGVWAPTTSYVWGGYTLADAATIEWGDWDTEGTNDDPDTCFNQGNNLVITSHDTDLSGPVVDGAITDGAFTASGAPVPVGEVVPGDVDYSAPVVLVGSPSVTGTTYGPVNVSATFNGVTKAL